ncbi:alpha-1,3/1,6-mannosyltransferase ALG2 [Halyomorpha halys]|uniref:alpha-1,3/1,6-mannosyltransferase ALG2 n=1 Tax=Halyomorpha halys TaxID=286706 RepID=UPI0006D4E368|nr:alpha-1,3/1,6-mannosyltransferase ALG2 [Halyomorpha halys]
MGKGKVIFLHPDLGLGGAERLVVDAALALQETGFDVKFITSYHNHNHCFEETRDGTLHVTTVGEWIPRSIFGRFYALCAYLKMIYCALYICFFERADCVFCDLVSIPIPIIHFAVSKVIFYCHFPDQLLSKPEGFLKYIYRIPLNWLEEKTTSCADRIYVNSLFTKSVFKETFKSIKKEPTVLYPSINTRLFDEFIMTNAKLPEINLADDCFLFLSINRYERKKVLERSMNAFKIMRESLSPELWEKTVLVIAGGYDPRVTENVEYFLELQKISTSLQIENKVYFLKSPSDADKIYLLNRSDCLIYTPHNEHFGIVPLEAMYCKKPVIAVRSGGPTETIVDGETGFLCDLDDSSFAKNMVRIRKESDLKTKMGAAGFKRFLEKFSFKAFSNQLEIDVSSLVNNKKSQ